MTRSSRSRSAGSVARLSEPLSALIVAALVTLRLPFDVARGMLMLNGARLKVFREVTKCKGVSEPRPQPPTKIERRQG
jgi:hypothetical protein